MLVLQLLESGILPKTLNFARQPSTRPGRTAGQRELRMISPLTGASLRSLRQPGLPERETDSGRLMAPLARYAREVSCV